jgi:Leu/Phe-tRNA-protein transferase
MVFDFNQTSEQRRQTCSGRIRAILRDPHVRFSEAAQDSIHGISFFEATMDQVKTAVMAGCQMARQLTGMPYVEDNIRTIEQTWHKAGRFSAFDQCFFGILQLDPCPKDGFRRKFHECGGNSLVWEIMARSSGR